MNLLLAALFGFAIGVSPDVGPVPKTEDQLQAVRDDVATAAMDLGYLSSLSAMGCGSYDYREGMEFLGWLADTFRDNHPDMNTVQALNHVSAHYTNGATEAGLFIKQMGCSEINGAVVKLRYTMPFVDDALRFYTPKG